jgi:hypothetical protein
MRPCRLRQGKRFPTDRLEFGIGDAGFDGSPDLDMAPDGDHGYGGMIESDMTLFRGSVCRREE